MKLFNAKNSLIDLPWGMNRLSVPPKSFSQDFMGTPDFIQLLVTSYDSTELAIVVAGPYELSMCASVPVAVNYVVQSMDEAIQKFGLGKEEKKTPEPEPVKEPEPEPEVKEEEKKEEEVKPVTETPAEPKKKSTKKTKK
jgi:Na+-transporting methylmalonyl-CoA/oxaloacetate decarboxylase gamma subunit